MEDEAVVQLRYIPAIEIGSFTLGPFKSEIKLLKILTVDPS